MNEDELKDTCDPYIEYLREHAENNGELCERTIWAMIRDIERMTRDRATKSLYSLANALDGKHDAKRLLDGAVWNAEQEAKK